MQNGGIFCLAKMTMGLMTTLRVGSLDKTPYYYFNSTLLFLSSHVYKRSVAISVIVDFSDFKANGFFLLLLFVVVVVYLIQENVF